LERFGRAGPWTRAVVFLERVAAWKRYCFHPKQRKRLALGATRRAAVNTRATTVVSIDLTGFVPSG